VASWRGLSQGSPRGVTGAVGELYANLGIGLLVIGIIFNCFCSRGWSSAFRYDGSSPQCISIGLEEWFGWSTLHSSDN
jgi:hypothetical protein